MQPSSNWGEQFGAQGRIADLRLQVLDRSFLQQAVAPGSGAERVEQELAVKVEIQAQRHTIARQVAEQGVPKLAEGTVVSRHKPIRRALKHLQMGGDLRQFGGYLHGTRGGAHQGNAFALKRNAVVPGRGMEKCAAEILQAGEWRDDGPAELADGGDEDIEFVLRAVGRVHAPNRVHGVKHRALHRGVQADMRRDAEAVGHVLDVGEYLGLT